MISVLIILFNKLVELGGVNALIYVSLFIISAAVLYSLERGWRKDVYLKVFCEPTTTNVRFINNVRSRVGMYIPPWWYSSIIGTVVPFGQDLALEYDRQIYHTDDDATFAVDWYPSKPHGGTGKNVIVLMPGLGLSSQNVCTSYLQLATQSL
jgi:hypothetical protein